jgi:hypothetical protein
VQNHWGRVRRMNSQKTARHSARSSRPSSSMRRQRNANHGYRCSSCRRDLPWRNGRWTRRWRATSAPRAACARTPSRRARQRAQTGKRQADDTEKSCDLGNEAARIDAHHHIARKSSENALRRNKKPRRTIGQPGFVIWAALPHIAALTYCRSSPARTPSTTPASPLPSGVRSHRSRAFAKSTSPSTR